MLQPKLHQPEVITQQAEESIIQAFREDLFGERATAVMKRLRSPRVKIVSFNLFKTLIVTPYPTETIFFKHLESQSECANFSRERQKAFTAAKQRAPNEQPFADEIYRKMPNNTFMEDELRLMWFGWHVNHEAL